MCRTIAVPLAGVANLLGFLAGTGPANADALGYLVNVTVAPGYHFSDPDTALAYGHGICDRVERGVPYAATIAAIKTDFATASDYQAIYLVNQAVDQLCPALLWQLRQSAAHYTGGPDVGG